MKFELTQRDLNGYLKNELVFYFDEDLFNDVEYKGNGKKFIEILSACKKAVDENLSKLPNKQKNKNNDSEVTFPGSICFNINAVPDIKDENNINSVFNLFQEITAYAVEKTLNIKLERKGRKWFKRPGAPTSRVEASEAGENIQSELERECWGCKGIDAHLNEEHTKPNFVCPLF